MGKFGEISASVDGGLSGVSRVRGHGRSGSNTDSGSASMCGKCFRCSSKLLLIKSRKIRLENINRKKWKIPFNWQSKDRNLIILVKTKTLLVLGMPLFLLSCPLVFGVPKWKLRVSLLSWICCLSLTITLLPRRKTLAKPSYVLLVVILNDNIGF